MAELEEKFVEGEAEFEVFVDTRVLFDPIEAACSTAILPRMYSCSF